MDEGTDLAGFWQRVEGVRELKLARLLWEGLLEESALHALIKSTLLQRAGTAAEVPCERMNGERCPRVVSADGTRADCGNSPAECESVVLHPGAVDEFVVTEERLAAKLTRDLRYKGAAACRSAGVWHLGKLDDGRPAILVSTRSREQWAANRALVSEITRGDAFVLWIPTEDFIPAKTAQELVGQGGVVLSLERGVRLGERGVFVAEPPPPVETPRPSSTLAATDPEFGAYVLENESWRDVSEEDYEGLLEREAEFQVFVNQRECRSSYETKAGGRHVESDVREKLFNVYRTLLESVRSPHFPERSVDQRDVQSARRTFEGPKGEQEAPLIMTRPNVGPRGETGYSYQPYSARRPTHLAIFFPRKRSEE